MDKLFFMRLAFKQAVIDPDEVPVGAIIVKDHRVVARAHNRQRALGDPTAHAELLAIQEACRKLGTDNLSGCTLYVSLEPCPMCAGAIIMSGVEHCIFGAFDKQSGCCGSLYNLPADPAFHHRVILEGGVLETEASELLRQFFLQKRNSHPKD